MLATRPLGGHAILQESASVQATEHRAAGTLSSGELNGAVASSTVAEACESPTDAHEQPRLQQGKTHSIDSRMWIHGMAVYLPDRTLTTQQIASRTGRPVSWFVERTGILERRRAGSDETAESMAVSAVRALEARCDYPLINCDLVIGATYTPSDTIATIAHRVQRAFSIANARVFQVSAACTSILVAMETAQAFICSGMAGSALIAAAEHNSLYSDDDDEQAGHLWGDAAAALLISSMPLHGSGYEVIDVSTRGLAHLGQGPDGIHLNPKCGGLRMPHGQDVFTHACRSMEQAANEMLHKNGLAASDLRLFVPHQANVRIVDRVATRVGVDTSRCAMTIASLGNTGCVSPLVSLLPYEHQLIDGDLILLITFGGGYSVGAALLRRCGDPVPNTDSDEQ